MELSPGWGVESTGSGRRQAIGRGPGASAPRCGVGVMSAGTTRSAARQIAARAGWMRREYRRDIALEPRGYEIPEVPGLKMAGHSAGLPSHRNCFRLL
jgi:hypothetical protein